MIKESFLFEGWGQALMIVGGLSMMSAHLLNRRLCRACPDCDGEERCG